MIDQKTYFAELIFHFFFLFQKLSKDPSLSNYTAVVEKMETAVEYIEKLGKRPMEVF